MAELFADESHIAFVHFIGWPPGFRPGNHCGVFSPWCEKPRYFTVPVHTLGVSSRFLFGRVSLSGSSGVMADALF